MTKLLPPQIGSVFLSSAFFPGQQIPRQVLKDNLFRSLPVRERAAISQGLQGHWTDSVEDILLDIYSTFGLHHMPTKDKLEEDIFQMA